MGPNIFTVSKNAYTFGRVNKERMYEKVRRENNIITVVQENVKLGFVGTPTKINKAVIDKIVDEKKIPVIAPLGLDENNQTFNINADFVVAAIAKEIKARRLIIMSDVEGVLDSNNKLIPEINSNSIKNLIISNSARNLAFLSFALLTSVVLSTTYFDRSVEEKRENVSTLKSNSAVTTVPNKKEREQTVFNPINILTLLPLLHY